MYQTRLRPRLSSTSYNVKNRISSSGPQQSPVEYHPRLSPTSHSVKSQDSGFADECCQLRNQQTSSDKFINNNNHSDCYSDRPICDKVKFDAQSFCFTAANHTNGKPSIAAYNQSHILSNVKSAKQRFFSPTVQLDIQNNEEQTSHQSPSQHQSTNHGPSWRPNNHATSTQARDCVRSSGEIVSSLQVQSSFFHSLTDSLFVLVIV